MTSNAAILDLVRRHVLWAGEEVEHVRDWPDGLALTTSFRHLAGGPEPDAWAVGRAPWVLDVVVLTRDDLAVEGVPERYGFLLLADGTDVALHDPAAVTELGRRLLEDLDPLAYAEILVQFHPHSSAERGVETDRPPWSRRTPDGLTVGFRSVARHRSARGATLTDRTEWTVEVPVGGPARWSTRPVD